MRLLIQRVREASVIVDGHEIARIGRGALIFVGVAKDDTMEDVYYLARKAFQLRIFDDAEGRLNNSISQVQGAFLVVSQFTLYADCTKGNRPSYIEAAQPEQAQAMYQAFVHELRKFGCEIQTGLFGARMLVQLVNDGPVTVMLESRGRTTG